MSVPSKDEDGKSYTIEIDEEDKMADGNARVVVRVECSACSAKGAMPREDEKGNVGQFYESQLTDGMLCAEHYLEELRTLNNNYIMKMGSNWQA
jgi:hypothetical protein